MRERTIRDTRAPERRPKPSAPTAPPLARVSLSPGDARRLQRTVGNQATLRLLTGRTTAAAGVLQRYEERHVEAAQANLKLPTVKVRALLDVGEGTGLFAEVYEAATSEFNLNPDGFATMLGSFRAVVRTKDEKPAGGASGFVRELLYGLQHIRDRRPVQFGAMPPDALAAALDRVGLKQEAAKVREEGVNVALGDQLGGDVVVWGRGHATGSVAETVQHKVVDGKTDDAVANELRNAIHQLAGRNKELAVPGTRRTADIVIMAANAKAAAGAEEWLKIIRGRMTHELHGKPLSAYVDLVRISGTVGQLEYDVKTDGWKEEKFPGDSVSKTLADKTPAKWEGEVAADEPGEKVAKTREEVSNLDAEAEIVAITKATKTLAEMNKAELSGTKNALSDAKGKWIAGKTATERTQMEALRKQRSDWATIAASAKKKQLEEAKSKEKAPSFGAFIGQWASQHPVEAARLSELESTVKGFEAQIKSKPLSPDALLLARFEAEIKRYADQIELLGKYETAAIDRNKAVPKDADQSQRLKALEEWNSRHPLRAKDADLHAESARLNQESIERDKRIAAEKEEQRKLNALEVARVCKPLLEAVGRVQGKTATERELTDSLFVVLEQAQHEAGIAALAKSLAAELDTAMKFAETGDIDKPSLAAFADNLSHRRDYHNLQGDLGEVANAVRMAGLGPEQRSGPVVIGSEQFELDKAQKPPQEVDVAFESAGGKVLHLQEVAWDLKTLENKLLGPDKESQRLGYARVLKAQRERDTSREVRMTYVVHKVTDEDRRSIGSNVAPKKLGPDVSEVKPGDVGAMATILFKRGYHLSLGGTLYTPEQVGAWVGT